MPNTGPMTADELLSLPEDEWKYELVDGRLVRMSPTGQEHSVIWHQLYRALDGYVFTHNLGIVNPPDAGYRLRIPDANDTVLSPDISFISTANLANIPPEHTPARKTFPPLAPDLAAEIASPDQYKPEKAEKARRYLEAGTPLVWVIWPPTRQVDIWQPGREAPVASLGMGETLDGGQVVPGFALVVAEIFP